MESAIQRDQIKEITTMTDLVKEILTDAEVDSEFFATRIHGGGNSVFGEYIRHEVSVWVVFCGYTIEYQTGLSFLGGDTSCPSDRLDLYECNNVSIREILDDEYCGDDEIRVGQHVLTLLQATDLIDGLESLINQEFDLITNGLSDDPDDYYIDDYDLNTYKMKDHGKYCKSSGINPYAREGHWVEGELYTITDNRTGSKETVVAESEEDAARRCGILIKTWDDSYIDRAYTVTVVKQPETATMTIASKLDQIVELIKETNRSGLLAEDSTNERIIEILREFDLDDDDDLLAAELGSRGLDRIRDAENGIY
jgi:hypothetical protein